MVARIFTQLDEQQALHWIGAAVVTLWKDLPHELQENIVQRAMSMAQGDVEVHAQITNFTNGHSRPPAP